MLRSLIFSRKNNKGKPLKNIFVILLIILLSSKFLFPSDIEIKSLKSYTDNKTSLPVIINGNQNASYLNIEFDINSVRIPALKLVFRFCDKNWNPTDNVFLANNGQNVSPELDVYNLPVNIEGARYRYEGSFPDEKGYVTFPFSGKWKFFITDSFDTSKVYASGRFFVINQELNLNVNIKKQLMEDKVYYPQDLARVFDLTASFNLPDDLFPNFVDHVEILENKKLDYPILIDRNFNTIYRQYYWDGNRKFSFSAKDIKPGNEYRETDSRNVNKFNSKNIKAQFDGLEYSRFFTIGKKDLNGSFLLTNPQSDFASYLNVTFSIRPPDPSFGDIYLVGAFNNWVVSPDYKMENSGGVYTKTVELKRGIYDYQYVTADYINDEIKNIDWLTLEGNNWQTTNEYYVFLFYNDPNYGGYDRIIAYRKIISK